MAITAFLFRSPELLNQVPRGPASLGHGPHSGIFSPTDLNFLSPGLYNNLTPTYFLRASQFRTQFNPSTVKVAPDLLISSTGCTCYLHRYISSFASLARSEVNMKQSSLNYFSKFCMWNFLHVCLHPLTHTFYRIIFQDNNTEKKTQKEITWTTAKQRWPSPYVTLARLINI